MKGPKIKQLVFFFLFGWAVSFLVLSALSRIEGFELSDRGLLLSPLIASIFGTLTIGIFYVRTGKPLFNYKTPKNIIAASLKFLFLVVMYLYALGAALIRFEILHISDLKALMFALIAAIIAVVPYYIYLKKKRNKE